MRTTISLDDDLVPLIKEYADTRSLALGKAVSELVRRAFNTPTPKRIENGLVVFDLPPDSPRVTSDLVARLDAEQE